MYYNGQHTEINITSILILLLNYVYMYVCVLLSGNTLHIYLLLHLANIYSMFANGWHYSRHWGKWKWKSLSCVRLFVTPGLSSPWNSPGQNTGVGSLCPGNLPNYGIEPRSHPLQVNSLLSEPPGKHKNTDWVGYPFSSWATREVWVLQKINYK